MKIKVLCVLLTLALAACATDDGEGTNNGNNANNTNNTNNTNNVNNTDELALSTLMPTSGNVAGGTSVALAGSGFETGMTVTFGDAEGTDLVVITPRTATVVTPAGMVGEVDVTVTTSTDSVTKTGAFSYLDTADPSIGFCQLQAQSPASAQLGMDFPSLFAIVFAEGLTTGAGQGEFIEGELGWGDGADVANYTFTAMAFNEDKDGLNPGDLSNDEYGAMLNIPSSGSFRYVARFRTQQRANEWVYCDLDGSENGVSEDQLGVIDVTEALMPTVGFCQLSAQSPVAATTGMLSPTIQAQVFVDGLTQGAGAGSGVQGELGYGNPNDAADAFNFVAMTYESDVDGLNQGDLANDQWGGGLTVSTAGDYLYLARFRVGSGDWTYCDLDASDNDGTNNPGTLTVSDPAVPEISFCRTETATASAITNQASGEITATIFAAGITQGAGAGANIEAEIGWGPTGSAPNTWTDFATTTYKEDADGLTQGDMANDRYAGAITATAAADYDYAMRVRLNGGTWLWCDTDGSQGGSGAFEPAKIGTLTVTDVVANLPDDCNLQFPQIHNKLLVGDSLDVFGRVIEGTMTGNGMPVTGIEGDLLVGPMGSDPTGNLAGFTVVASTVVPSGMVINPAPNQDEYKATFTATAPGAYMMVYRFTADGGQTYGLCDMDGRSTGYSPEQAGVINVYDAASNPDLVDYCRVWQTAVTGTTGMASPLVTVEVFEAGLTDSGGATTAIEAEIGYGSAGANPAIDGAYTWNPTLMPYKGVGPAAPNNWEYEGNIYPMAMTPSVGNYDVAVRVRRTGVNGWVYCDTLNTTMDFFTSQTTDLTVN